MGLLKRIFRWNDDSSPSSSSVEDVYGLLEEVQPEFRLQLVAVCTFMACMAGLRLILSSKHLRTLQNRQAVLDLTALNDAICHKEVFVAYLNAALLEPVLAIGGMQQVVGQALIINVFTIGSIFWWIWLVTDAFDFADVMQHYTYHVKLRQELGERDANAIKDLEWLQFKSRKDDALAERLSLIGSFRRDVALWFMLACIAAAWLPGVISHRDVLHAYVVVFLWSILHHFCRKTTCWNTNYYFTFLFPSAAVMPIEYCMPLQDTADCVEDLDFVISYRQYVADRTGVKLMILS